MKGSLSPTGPADRRCQRLQECQWELEALPIGGAHGGQATKLKGHLYRMRTFLAALLIAAGASCAAVTALTLDDQPIGGVSQPSRWATVITPDPSYKPLLCAPAPAALRRVMLPVLYGVVQFYSSSAFYVCHCSWRRSPIPYVLHQPAELGVLSAEHRKTPLPQNTLTAQHLPSHWDWCGL